MLAKKATLLTLLFLLAFYWLNQSQAIWQNLYPQGDDAAFLATAESIRQEGGVVQLLPRMLTGDYVEANRHPLYVSLISIFATRSLDFFVWAKVFNLFLGLAFLSLVFLIMRRLLNELLALLMVFCFAQSYFFVNQFAKVSSEPLLMIFVLLGWYLLTSSGDDLRRIKLAGISTALAFLTKVTGIFLLGAEALTWLVTLFLDRGNKGFKGILGVIKENKGIWLFLATFLVVASPLLWRNVLVYHNPFHNYNAKLLWISSGEERRSVDLYAGEHNDLVTFLQEQSFMEMGGRLVRGMLGESVVFTQMVFFEYGRFRGAFILFLLFLVALWKDSNRRRALFSLFLFLQFFLFFSWYFKISSHFRYVMPIWFLFYYYLFGLFREIWVSWGEKGAKWIVGDRWRGWVSFFLLLASFGLLGWETQQHDFVSPLGSAKVSSAYQEVQAWLGKNIKSEDHYLNGPGHDFQVEWLTATSSQSLELPYVDDFSDLHDFLNDFNVKYVILSRSVILAREQVLSQYFDVSSEGVLVKQTPQGWDLVAKEEGRQDPRYIIYKVKN